jgi:hypothetical protein
MKVSVNLEKEKLRVEAPILGSQLDKRTATEAGQGNGNIAEFSLQHVSFS